MFFKIGVLKTFKNFTRKHLLWSLFLIELQACRPLTLLKTDPTRLFHVNIAKFLRTDFYTTPLVATFKTSPSEVFFSLSCAMLKVFKVYQAVFQHLGCEGESSCFEHFIKIPENDHI